jgi:hypothetical protein
MSRLLAGLLAAALVAMAGNSGAAPAPRTEKEEPPKVAVNDPAKLAEDLHFAIQGEYLGKRVGTKGVGDSLGAQVIALGDGKFEVKLFRGGLPGAGWDGRPPAAGKGPLDHDRVEVKSAEKPEETLGVLAPGTNTKNRVFTVFGKKSVVLRKIERKSPTLGAKPPKGAVVLFSGPSDADKWDKATIAKLSDGKFLAAGVRTKRKFQSFHLHIEFRTPWMPRAAGRDRGSSGIYLQDRYRFRVLDNFGLEGADKERGAIHEEHELIIKFDVAVKKAVSIGKALDNLNFFSGSTAAQGQLLSLRFPKEDLENLYIKNDRGEMVPYSSFMKIEKTPSTAKVNMCFPPMTWQTYDIDFTAAVVDSAGVKTKHAKATVKHNGVVIYDGLELKGNTLGGGNSINKKLTEPGALYLQNHGDPVVFKNIWAVVK